jgi:hypothetical protein
VTNAVLLASSSLQLLRVVSAVYLLIELQPTVHYSLPERMGMNRSIGQASEKFKNLWCECASAVLAKELLGAFLHS